MTSEASVSFTFHQTNSWVFFMMNKSWLTERRRKKQILALPNARSLWAKNVKIQPGKMSDDSRAAFFLSHWCFISKFPQEILSPRASGCPFPRGPTTCLLWWSTRFQSCEPSPPVCGCVRRGEASGPPSPTPSLKSPTKWCSCKACTLPPSCSSTARYFRSLWEAVQKLHLQLNSSQLEVKVISRENVSQIRV